MLVGRESCSYCSGLSSTTPRSSSKEEINDDTSMFEEQFFGICSEEKYLTSQGQELYATNSTDFAKKSVENNTNTSRGSLDNFRNPPASPSCVSLASHPPSRQKTTFPLDLTSSPLFPADNRPDVKSSRTTALASCLRNGTSNGYRSLKERSQYKYRHRRVRFGKGGEWNPICKCLFSHFHDDVLMNILSHLDMNDLLVSAKVCRRWKYCSLHDHTWKWLDATSFVQTRGDKSPERTSEELVRYLNKYSYNMEALTIRSIEHRLLPDIALPTLSTQMSAKSLCELTLTSYAGLTDIHVHSMLLSSQMNGYDSCTTVTTNVKSNFGRRIGSTNTCTLRKLVLENCPMLTNGVVRSIGMFCSSHLEELSLRGNRNVTNIAQLRDLWNVVFPEDFPKKKPEQLRNAPTIPLFSHSPHSSANALEALFMGPSKPKPHISSLFPSPNLSSSPFPADTERASDRNQPSEETPKSSYGGKLRRLNVSRTGVSSKSFVGALSMATRQGGLVSIETLCLNGDDWSDDLFERLTTEVLHLESLQNLDIGCATNIFTGSEKLTYRGLRYLCMQRHLESKISTSPQLRALTHINLSGQKSITSSIIADLLYAAPNLIGLNLSGCSGIANICLPKENTPSQQMKLDPLPMALLKFGSTHGKRSQEAEIGECGKRKGLVKLSLWQCFKSRQQTLALANSNEDAIDQETKFGRELIKALCSSPSSKTLEELDLDSCYFITDDDVNSLLENCPRLMVGKNINLNGTKYSEEKRQYE